MKISSSIRIGMIGLCVASMLSIGVQAQDTPPPKKTPQLTMDDFDNRTAVGSSSTPVVASEGVATITSGKNPVVMAQPGSPASARVALETAWKNMASLKSGRMQTFIQSSEGASQMLLEFTGSDRARINKDGIEIIVIDSTIYTKVPGQGWMTKTKDQQDKYVALSFKVFANISPDKKTQVQILGEETINHVPMIKFRVADGSDTNYTWVGKNDGLVHKMERAPVSSGKQVRVVFSGFNEEFSIRPPEQ